MFAIACDTHALITALEERLSSLLSRLSPSSRKGLLSVTLAVPPVCTPDLSHVPPDSVYWARGRGPDFRLGSGSAITFQRRGRERFASLERDLQTIRRGWLHLDPDGTGLQAQAFLGLAFAPGAEPPGDWLQPGDARLSIPSLLYQRHGPLSGLTFSHLWEAPSNPERVLAGWLTQLSRLTRGASSDCELDPRSVRAEADPLVRLEEIPADAEWLARVTRALEAIRQGGLEKLVLTRSIRVRRRRPIRAERLLDWLRTHYPTCTQIAVTGRTGTLVAASPERLISLRGDRVVSDAVAGTAPRGRSRTADAELGRALEGSDKARQEHKLVVDEMVQALTPLCTGISAPSQPVLMRLPRVQHLWSPIHARARSGVSLMQLAERVHPTCAVGGMPRAEALAWVAEHEPEPRGWYTGALGWLDALGDGDLSVILRCALIQGGEARLYGGAGIVSQSDPEEELRETEWKLQTMLDALDAA
jgi:isochorismate synthase